MSNEKQREGQLGHRIQEATVAYLAHPVEDEATRWAGRTRVSVKNQVTLPAAMCRAMDIRQGDELALMAHGDIITVTRLPRTEEEWVGWLKGGLPGIEEWSTDAKIDAWTKAERDSWDDD